MDNAWTLSELERVMGNNFHYVTRGCPFCGKFNVTPEFEQMELDSSIYGGYDEEEGHLVIERKHWYLTRLQLHCNYCGASGSNIERSEQELKHMKAGGYPYTSDATLINQCASSWMTRRG